MAYKVFDDLNYSDNSQQANVHKIILDSESGQRVELPDDSFVSDANITRSGVDLVLETPDGIVVVEGYFSSMTPPDLVAPDGTTLTPSLVDSFMRSGDEYAENLTHADVSPVGAVQEIAGEATVTRLDGTVEVVGIGTPIYQGDVVETDENGAVNIMFVDQTTFAVSEDARLAIDEYVFDPATQTGTTNFSVLKGVFVFTSGLIGREDPDDVMINTPSGSIGIRGTIIAGDVDAGEITVIEGAIVLYDLSGNTMTLSTQFETAKFNLSDSTIENLGELAANDVSTKFMSVSTVAADLFSSIEDAANDDTSSEDTSDDGTSSSGEEGQEDKDASADQAGEADGENTETASAEEEVITSDDIIGSADEETDETETAGSTDGETQTDNTAADDTTSGETQDTAPPVDDTPPPFNVEVTRLPFFENSNGENIAVVQGNFTNFTNLTLLGTSANYYDVSRVDDNTLLISLKPGVSMDHEDEFSLFFQASNELGTANVVQSINPLSLNVDEPVTYDPVAPNVSGVDNYFSGSDGTILTYDISQEFSDAEGITNISLVGSPSHADLSTISIVDGILTVQLEGGVSDGSFNFTVQADTTTEFVQETFTFDIFAATTGGAVITTPNDVYSGNDTSITVAANNVSVFADIDNATNNVQISGNNAYVKTGGGDDDIIINAGSNNYHIYGDAGDDIIHHNAVLGKAYGGDGDDMFIIENNSVQGQLEALSTATTKIDGGDGVDTLHFSSATSGNINLSNVDDGLITNIEVLDFDNGTAHMIDIDYDDVINMTDDSNTLIIDLDANDTLSFTNTSPNSFFQAPGTVEVDSQTYNVFSDGTVTLLVDVEATNVSGIV